MARTTRSEWQTMADWTQGMAVAPRKARPPARLFTVSAQRRAALVGLALVGLALVALLAPEVARMVS